ncbi:mechanosensitive ion channel domain-containing protein [Shewanella sp. NIFS-20-20]|uniref:mechanosensitive ion channel domain-containing protein n=1 Tax=Shewanella sp. NIFS-20-20 TaxID=2853806 RepID=UPI001C457F79|nr:mechanosensitive ion channel domain-containing protein [Shewanella sp. NIFS-20-20]MBV7316647.1 mechanosensitive ion channel family protein [Shewanella sp. NIFS-20-20]
MMLKLGLVLVYLGAFYLIQSRLRVWIKALAKQKQVNPARAGLVIRFLIGALMFVTISLLAVTLGFGYQDVTVFVSSVFAVLGVALIAQWSILSNITAGVLIFFVFPYRIGERIKVVDKDEDISGTIKEIALFHVLIRRDSGDMVTYPNSLMLQKPVLKLAITPPVAVANAKTSSALAAAAAPELENNV